MSERVSVSCPHCKREYSLAVSMERLSRLRKQAMCSRCGKKFDIASSIIGSHDSSDDQSKPMATAVPAQGAGVASPKTDSVALEPAPATGDDVRKAAGKQPRSTQPFGSPEMSPGASAASEGVVMALVTLRPMPPAAAESPADAEPEGTAGVVERALDAILGSRWSRARG